ncbi:MAG: DUF4376 domain-containing protein [Bacilli bacterium]|nr:DUF4376 domain-containing protein [Bacilli bacterium]
MAKSTVIFDTPQEQIVYGILGDTYVYVNEREIQVEESVMDSENGEGETRTVTKYVYDERHFPVAEKTESGVIEALKKQINNEITIFDSGQYAQFGDKAVNDFTINGIHMWLDKDTRNGLKFRFESQLALDEVDTTLWYNITPIELNLNVAIGLVQALEVYASKCFDRTAAHRQAVSEMDDLVEIFNYDYTEGYPAHCNFGEQE